MYGTASERLQCKKGHSIRFHSLYTAVCFVSGLRARGKQLHTPIARAPSALSSTFPLSFAHHTHAERLILHDLETRRSCACLKPPPGTLVAVHRRPLLVIPPYALHLIWAAVETHEATTPTLGLPLRAPLLMYCAAADTITKAS